MSVDELDRTAKENLVESGFRKMPAELAKMLNGALANLPQDKVEARTVVDGLMTRVIDRPDWHCWLTRQYLIIVVEDHQRSSTKKAFRDLGEGDSGEASNRSAEEKLEKSRSSKYDPIGKRKPIRGNKEERAIELHRRLFVRGVALGRKTKPELIEAAIANESCAQGLTRNARFWRAVADRLPNNTTTVRDALSNEELKGIYEAVVK